MTSFSVETIIIYAVLNAIWGIPCLIMIIIGLLVSLRIIMQSSEKSIVKHSRRKNPLVC